MKTFCLTLGLLLLTFLCCNATSPAVEISTVPRMCCFSFSKAKFPLKRVTDIRMTHSSCSHKAFIVTSVLGRKICYKQDMEWALKVYRQHQH
ncbi:C-C motif chemokine 3-like 1 [Cololabis saira]|uniref:C-C motif chemokine 3-like 1 n=1 Tax=Cololabis saira TaxID=129043 RepID=UPI002AD2325A|nr:C-C motif chemokine 3-like 1 [Cololabis saira]